MEANQSKQADAMLGGFYEKLGINKDNVNGIKDVGVLKAAENAMD